jgi:hypothetical protein
MYFNINFTNNIAATIVVDRIDVSPREQLKIKPYLNIQDLGDNHRNEGNEKQIEHFDYSSTVFPLPSV